LLFGTPGYLSGHSMTKGDVWIRLGYAFVSSSEMIASRFGMAANRKKAAGNESISTK
jgi:hypothetical protein